MADPVEQIDSKIEWRDSDGNFVSATSPKRKTQYTLRIYADGTSAYYRWDPVAATYVYEEAGPFDKDIAYRFDNDRKWAAQQAKDAAAAESNRYQFHTNPDGTVSRIEKGTLQVDPVQGLPEKEPNTKPSYVPAGQVDRTQQWIVYFDPVTSTNKEILNPNYNAEYAALEADKIRASISASQASAAASNRPPQGATSSPTDYMREGREADKWAWEKGTQFPWQQETWQKNYDLTKGKNESDADYNRRRIEMETAQNEALRKQWLEQNEQAKNELVSNLADWQTKRQVESMPYMVDQSWATYPGFENTGPVSQLWKMGGATGYQAPTIPRWTVDPQSALAGNDAWLQAQQAKRGGR